MFHDLHDTMKFSPSYRKAVGAVKLADRAMNMAGGQETGLAAQAGRAGFELAQETGLPGIFDQKVNAQDRATHMSLAESGDTQSDTPPPTSVAEPDVLAELAGSATAFGQGVGFNMVDDLFDATGQKPSADYVREQVDRHPNAARTGSFWRSALAAGLAPGTVGAQGLAVGMTGGVGEYGRTGDPEKAALLGALDGTVAANGALLGQGVSAAGDYLRGPFQRETSAYLQQYNDPFMRSVARGTNAMLGDKSASFARSPEMRAVMQAAYHKERLGPRFRRAPKSAMDNQPLVQTPVEVPPEAAPLFPSEPEPAQERPAVADLPTLHYALQATLASGRAGLSPEDEQALTEAVVQGDQAAISATDFRLRQRYPAYARRVERELRAYNEEN
jgi:hypothetical protein